MNSKSKLILRYFILLAVLGVGLFLQSCKTGEKQSTTNPELNNIRVLSSNEDLMKALDSNSTKLMVIDLYADWCMPCKQLAPVMNSLSTEHSGSAVFYKVNVDKNPEIATMFGVQGIPHVIFMKNKEPFFALTGLYPKETYQKVITVCGAADSPDSCQKQMQM